MIENASAAEEEDSEFYSQLASSEIVVLKKMCKQIRPKLFGVKFRKFKHYLLFLHEENALTRPTTAAFIQTICDGVIEPFFH